MLIISNKIHIQVAREVSNHFSENANFCLFIVGNLKDVDHKSTNKRRKLKIQRIAFAEVQERFRRRYRTEAPTRTTIRAGIFNPRPAGRLRPPGEFCAAREG